MLKIAAKKIPAFIGVINDRIFDNPYWGMSKETAEAGANVRRLIVLAEKYDVFIRQKN